MTDALAKLLIKTVTLSGRQVHGKASHPTRHGGTGQGEKLMA
jgi:hypothetical protein